MGDHGCRHARLGRDHRHLFVPGFPSYGAGRGSGPDHHNHTGGNAWDDGQHGCPGTRHVDFHGARESDHYHGRKQRDYEHSGTGKRLVREHNDEYAAPSDVAAR